MALLGNREGPRLSEIKDGLGPSYFGITAERLESDIGWEEHSEARGEVAPVHVDEAGEPYVVFRTGEGQTRRFYPRLEGYTIEGEIETHTQDEQRRWRKRGEVTGG